MHTVKLRVNDSVYEKLIWLLSKFSKDEVEVIAETNDFWQNQKYLAGELKEIIDGTASFIEIDALEQQLENTIRKNENLI